MKNNGVFDLQGMGLWRYDGNETIELHDATKARLHHIRLGKEFKNWWHGVDINTSREIWVGFLI